MRIKVIELERMSGGIGLGVILSCDAFIGVSVLVGWWQLNVGLRRISL